MDSLGLSLFRPDFIITSFYRVFGFDPTGFGCLLIKKSVMASLENQSGHAGSGIVKITPVFPTYLSDSMDNFPGFGEDEEASGNGEVNSETRPGSQLPAFSGAYASAQLRDVFESEMEHDNSSDRDGASTIFEETESISIGEVMKSPVFSEDESHSSYQFSDHFKEIPEEEQFSERRPTPDNRCYQEIEEEPETSKSVRTVRGSSHKSLSSNHNGSASEICLEKEIAIRRETEGEFRLLERGDRSRIAGGRFFGRQETEQPGSRGRRVSFSMEDNRRGQSSRTLEPGEISANSLDDEDYLSNGDYGVDQDSDRAEPEIICRHLDHINILGLNKTTSRLRFLINWLVTSLLQLRLPSSNGKDSAQVVHIYGPKIKYERGASVAAQVVHIYGPKIKYERGASVAFNVRDRNRGLIGPEFVQKLAESNGISLGVAILNHIRILDSPKHQRQHPNLDDTTLCKPMENGRHDGESGFMRVEVVTASLGFLTNFDYVYNLWAFVAKFLDPVFVKEGALPLVTEEVEE